MKYIYKQSILISLIILILGGVIYSIIPTSKDTEVAIQEEVNNENIENTTQSTLVESEPISMCYYREKKTDRGFKDVSWISFEINGNQIKGEFRNLPAETDSKVGKFEGTVGEVVKEKMARDAYVVWDSFAEGENNKEELIFDFGDGSATVAFGEMVDNGEGLYVYKDKNNLFYQETMSQIDCEKLMSIVE